MKAIYEYQDYRDFLKDRYAFLKKENSKFSFRYFSQQAGFKSPNFLKQVIDGISNLSSPSIKKFVKAFKLSRDEAHFFENLVHFNQAKDLDEKELFTREIFRSRKYRELYPLSEAQLSFLSKWYFLPLWEMTGLPSFREDPVWIAKQLIPAITSKEVKTTIEELLKLGLLKRDADGRLEQVSSSIGVPDKFVSNFVARFHQEMMIKAYESIGRIPREERELMTVTFKMSESSTKKIKELIQRFRKDVLETVSGDGDPNGVYQMNFQFFPFVKIKEKEDKS